MTGASIGTGPPFPAGNPRSVLLVGDPAGVPWTLRDVTVVDAALAHAAQYSHRFDLVLLTTRALAGDATHRRSVLHTAVQHLAADGRLALLHAEGDAAADLGPLDLEVVGAGEIGELTYTLFARSGRFTVHDLLFEARATTTRVGPHELHARLRSALPPLVLDTRTSIDRGRYGTIEGAIHLPRTVLEWRLDPANGFLHPAVTGFDQPLVIVCNHGYSSTIAALAVQRLGYADVSDLAGGMQAWRTAGLPTVPPDHTFVEFA